MARLLTVIAGECSHAIELRQQVGNVRLRLLDDEDRWLAQGEHEAIQGQDSRDWNVLLEPKL